MTDAVARHAEAKERQRREHQGAVLEGVGQMIRDRDEMTMLLRNAAAALENEGEGARGRRLLAARIRRQLAEMARR